MTTNPTTATTTTLSKGNRFRRGAAALATVATVGVGLASTSAAASEPLSPDERVNVVLVLEEVCKRFAHPVAADLGAVLPPNAVVDSRAVEILNSIHHAGIDCTMFNAVL